MEVTISRLPESVIDALEDEISAIVEEYADTDSNITRTLQLLIASYHAAWDALEGNS